MYINKSLSPVVKLNLSTTSVNFEPLWVSLSLNKIKYIVGGYYRHPNTSVNDFRDSLMDTLGKLRRYKRCIIAGDINIDCNKYGSVQLTTDFIDELISLNFISFAFLPTRITKSSATAIDHIYTNCYSQANSFMKCGIVIYDISDHLCNFLFIVLPVCKPPKEKLRLLLT